MKKKILSILLAGVMALLAGCGSGQNDVSGGESAPDAAEETVVSDTTEEEAREPVTLVIWLRQNAKANDQDVEDYINSLPQVQALNVEIELKCDGTDYVQQTSLALATQEHIDILFDSSGFALFDRARQGAYYDISELLKKEKFQALYNHLPEFFWDSVTVDGGIYAVPTYKDYSQQYGFSLEKGFVESHNIDVNSLKSYEDMTPILEMLKEEGRNGFMVTYNNNRPEAIMTNIDFQVVLDKVVVRNSDTSTAINLYETEEFRDFCHLMREWNEAGYFDKNILTLEAYDIAPETYGMTGTQYTFGLEKSEYASNGVEIVPVLVGHRWIDTSSCCGSAYAITSYCENPERALEFLQLWCTDPEVKNAFYLGVPGLTYELNEEGKATKAEDFDSMWSGQNWTTLNEEIAYPLITEDADQLEQLLNWCSEGEVSDLLGFVMDTTNVVDEVAAVNGVVSEYAPLLWVGLAEDVDGTIDNMLDAMNAAGMDRIVEEAQKQLDDFFAAK